jgi:alpha-tubulin suppressor-like RCC1 family protein
MLDQPNVKAPAALVLLALASCEGPFIAPAPYPPPPDPPASVTVTPESATVITDDTLQLNAVVRDSAGNVLPNVAVSWTSADTTIAAITSALGTVRGQRPGTTRIRAFVGTITGSVTVFVTPVVFNTFAAGAQHVCAAANNRRVYCWGDNDDGQIGIGTTSFLQAVPKLVALGPGAVSVAAGGGHSCALTTTGTAYCWGRNQLGQLGRGPAPGDPLLPSSVLTSQQLITVTGGGNHTCGLGTSDDISCWGANIFGQVGDGSTLDRPTPRPVNAATTWNAVATGANHSCAIATDHTAWCWGANSDGQLGDSTTTNRDVPTVVVSGQQFVTIAAGGGHTCALTTAGAIYCWGRNLQGQTGTGLPDSIVAVPTAAATVLTFRAVTAGAQHSCGIATDSAAYCWGENGAGQLGDSSNTPRPTPVLVHGGLRFQSLSAGAAFTCGLTGGLVMYCWGDGTQGQLGRALIGSSTVPVRVAGQ